MAQRLKFTGRTPMFSPLKTEQFKWSPASGWRPGLPPGALGAAAQVVFAFGSASLLEGPEGTTRIRAAYPHAHVIGCSTGGEIHGAEVNDGTLAVTAVQFEHTELAVARAPVSGVDESFAVGVRLARQLPPTGLRHVFVLSEGLAINASDFVEGLNSTLPRDVTVSGGFAADGNRFQKTTVWCDGTPSQGVAVALGLYGERLRVGVAATGGWGVFGPDRLITKSRKNVLFEFDGKPALALYKQYLGDYATQLPAIGLAFPLDLRIPGHDGHRVLRALIGVDEAQQSITFAGNVPEGCHARFMIGRVDQLIESAAAAAEASRRLIEVEPQLALVVSCNARRMVLKQRVEEEVEGVSEVFGSSPTLAGFYSYGEIAPAGVGGPAELHNETMTITSLAEV